MSILCYHTVDADWRSRLAMTPTDFRAHAQWLARHRHVVDLSTAVRLMNRRGRLPRGVVALTFDDGLRGVYDHVLPTLRSLGLPATVFVVGRTVTGDQRVDWIDDPPDDHVLETLDREQLLEIAEGGIEIASHSQDHRVLPTLEHEACEADLRLSRDLLEDLLGGPVSHLAYPRGRHDDKVRGAAQRAGYSHAFSLPESVETVGPYALPRVGVYRHNGMTTLRVKSSRPYLSARLHPASVPVRGTVRALRGARPPERRTGSTAVPLPAGPVSPNGTGVAYVMSRFPKISETFILNEMLAVERKGVSVHLHPLLREHVRLMHPGATKMVARAHYEPFLSRKIVASQWWFLRNRPRQYVETVARVLLGTAGSLNFTVGAIGILPKVSHMARKLERDGVAHVHCHFASHPAVAGYAIHRLTGLPFSFTAHGSDLHVDRHMLPQKVAAASFVIAVSEYNRQLIIEECGPWAAEKVHVVRCGVDTSVFRAQPGGSDDGSFRLLCIGTLHEVKGQHILIDAARVLRDQGADFSLTFIGGGPGRRDLERRVQAAGLHDAVDFRGETDRDGVLQALRTSDVLVAPSVPTAGGKREGIPIVLMEAMACGLPVISSELSGIPELIQHDVTGLLLPPGDVRALADAIARLKDDPGLRARLGDAARQWVLRFYDLERNAQQLIGLFNGRAPADEHVTPLSRPAAAVYND